MLKGILVNMWVFMVPSLPEPGTVIKLVCVGGTEWQSTESKMYASRWIGGINTVDAGIL